MRDYKTYFRKPVEFAQYHFLIVRFNGIWRFDSGTWEENLSHSMLMDAKKEYHQSDIKLCTSPSDNETVLTRIIKEMNK